MKNLPKPEEAPFVGRFVERAVYLAGRKCCIARCNNKATHEVYRKGFAFYTHSKAGILTTQAHKCPFICEQHAIENESNKEPDSASSYGGFKYKLIDESGFISYSLIEDAFPEIYSELSVPATSLIVTLDDLNQEVAEYILRNPTILYEMKPRQFEILIASIMKNHGFDVELTPETRDGGIDIVATQHSDFGNNLFLIECKRYSPKNKVGIEKVQRLNGIIDNYEGKKATRGMLVTTSTFSKDAAIFAEPLEFRLSLHDYNDITAWISRYAKSNA
jgi:restriction endonuclease Mrr